jgi:hypothetical protein
VTNITLTIRPSNGVWHQIINERRFTAQTGAPKFQGRGGSRFGLTLQWFNLTGARRAALSGEIKAIDGGRNRLVVSPPQVGYVRRGAGGGAAVLLVGAHSAGAIGLSFDGATPNVTNWLRKDDFINIANELHSVVADLTTSAGGTGIIEIWPPLMQNRPDNEPVVIAQASVYGIFFQTAPAAFPAAPYSSSDFISDNITLSLEQDILG